MMKKLGIALLIISAVILAGSGIYYLFLAIFNEPGMPFFIKISLSALIIGIIILLIALVKERLEDKKNEKYDHS